MGRGRRINEDTSDGVGVGVDGLTDNGDDDTPFSVFCFCVSIFMIDEWMEWFCWVQRWRMVYMVWE